MRRFCALAGRVVAGLIVLTGLALAAGCSQPKEEPRATEAVSATGAHDPADFCAEHHLPEAQCAICLPDLLVALDAVTAAEQGQEPVRSREISAGRPAWPRIRLASLESAPRAGLRAVPAGEVDAVAHVGGPAELVADGNRAAALSSPVSGTVRQLLASPGEHVARGQLLALLSSPEVAGGRAEVDRALAEAERARRELERQEELFRRQLTPERDLLEARADEAVARAALSAATTRLASLTGEPATARGTLIAGDDAALLSIRSPMTGEVSGRAARLGQAVQAGDPILEVVDRTRIWCDISLGQPSASAVRSGQAVTFESQSLPGRRFHGRVINVLPDFDAGSRTVRVRAWLDNAGGLLRPNLFGSSLVNVGEARAEARVPEAALVRYAGRTLVFVREAADLYEVRPVVIGANDGEMVDVTTGLAPGEEVVTDGAFLLKTQVSKGSIGAGCCETAARAEH